MAYRDTNQIQKRLGEPIQILKESERLEIDQVALNSVLCHPDVEDKPISVVSVVGTYRAGKSFLLNYFLRYLENKGYETGGRSSWMGNDEEPLEGFLWAGGPDLVTKGIFIWSKPFIVKKESREIAVFIVDPQGSFDMDSQRETFKKVFALALLMSSCTIYNLKDIVGQNDLEYLEFCVEYSKMANEDRNQSCPLQDFWFLMRDWKKPRYFKYGLDGGQKYLTEKILAVESQDNLSDLNKIRSGLEKSFDSLKCYLMPPPGEKVETETDDYEFKGNWKDLNSKFQESLDDLCHKIFNPTMIQEKTGMTGQALLNFLIEACENAENNDQFVSESLLSAAIKSRCAGALVKWTKKYVKKVMKKLGGTFVEREKFKDILDTQRLKVQEKFLKELHVIEDRKEEYAEIFTRHIITINLEFEMQNEKLWMIEKGKLVHMSNSIWSEYKKNMSKVKMVDFDSNHKKYSGKAMKEFEARSGKMAKRQKSEVEAAKKLLTDGIDCTRRNIASDFDYKEAENLYTVRKVISDSIDKFEEAFKLHPEDDARNISIKFFDDQSIRCNNREIGGKWAEARIQLHDILNGCFPLELREMNAMVRALHRKYDEAAKQKTGGKVSSDRLHKEQMEAFTKEAMNIYKDCKREVGEDTTETEVSVKQWKEAIDLAWRRHVQLNKSNEIKIYVRYFELIKPMFEETKANMKIGEDKYIGDPLLKIIAENKQSYMDKCSEFTSSHYMTSDNDVSVPSFSDRIGDLCEVWRKMDGINKSLADVNFQLLLKEIELQYLSTMREKISGSHAEVEDLQDLHDKVVADLLASADRCESEMIKSGRAHLQNSLNAHLELIKTWNESNKSIFKRKFAIMAGNVGLTAGTYASLGVILGTSLEIGLTTLTIATAATGVGAAVLAGVAVAGIGYVIYKSTKNKSATEFIDVMSTTVKERSIDLNKK